MKARIVLFLLTGAIGLVGPTFADAPNTPISHSHNNGQPAIVTPLPAEDHTMIPPGAPVGNAPAHATEGVSATLTPCPSAEGCGTNCCPTTCCPTTSCPGAGAAPLGLEIDAGFLLLFQKSSPTPPLVTTSNLADLGVLGQASTRTLVGGRGYDMNPFVGGAFNLRYLVDGNLGVGVGGFFTENGTRTLGVSGLALIGIPVVDPANNQEYALRLAGPLAATGRATVELASRLWGLQGCGVVRADLGDGMEVDMLGGFRFLQLAESLSLTTSTTSALPGFFDGNTTPAGSIYNGVDFFGTRNSFYGGFLGAQTGGVFSGLSVAGRASIALGCTEQSVNVSGSTTLLAPGAAPAVAPGNIYSQRSNIGRNRQSRFGVIPHAGLALGFQATDFARLTFGYDFLYWNSVVRPGSQIDRTVNPSFPPILDDGTRLGATRPAPRFVTSDYWAQVLTFGLELSF